MTPNNPIQCLGGQAVLLSGYTSPAGIAPDDFGTLSPGELHTALRGIQAAAIAARAGNLPDHTQSELASIRGLTRALIAALED